MVGIWFQRMIQFDIKNSIFQVEKTIGRQKERWMNFRICKNL